MDDAAIANAPRGVSQLADALEALHPLIHAVEVGLAGLGVPVAPLYLASARGSLRHAAQYISRHRSTYYPQVAEEIVDGSGISLRPVADRSWVGVRHRQVGLTLVEDSVAELPPRARLPQPCVGADPLGRRRRVLRRSRWSNVAGECLGRRALARSSVWGKVVDGRRRGQGSGVRDISRTQFPGADRRPPALHSRSRGLVIAYVLGLVAAGFSGDTDERLTVVFILAGPDAFDATFRASQLHGECLDANHLRCCGGTTRRELLLQQCDDAGLPS